MSVFALFIEEEEEEEEVSKEGRKYSIARGYNV